MKLHDEKILLSLWKWKLLTSSALAEMCFQGSAPSTAYRKLWALKKEGFLITVPIGGSAERSAYAWTLTKKGFKAIHDRLPTLKSDGYKSESIEHDHFVNAVHIGEWLKGAPSDCELFSEQELRRLHVEQYPKWVPHVEIHRPDGYWRTKINEKGATIALEVELNRKSGSQYRGVGQFYANREKLYRIIWVVETKGLAEHIQSEIKAIASQKYGLHSFVLLREFKEHGWAARFFLGKDLGRPMGILFGIPDEKFDEKLSKHVCTVSLLNTLKSPHKSRSSSFSPKFQKSDRVGISNLLTPPTENTSNVAPVTHKIHSTNNSNGGQDQ